MNYKPDYGFYLLQSGISQKVDQYFYDFRLYSITILGPKQYSTMVEMPRDGEIYALSLDFDEAQLKQILSKADGNISSRIALELKRGYTPRTIDLVGFVSFGVRARLGQLQINTQEKFVPLIAQDIF